MWKLSLFLLAACTSASHPAPSAPRASGTDDARPPRASTDRDGEREDVTMTSLVLEGDRKTGVTRAR
jgi:hypothetical protein